jgi:hypothetical protein
MHLIALLLFSWLTACLPAQAAGPAPRFGEPVVITCAGQSSDLLLARQFFGKAGVTRARTSARFTADSLAGVKTLVLVVGGSSKGLGQAKNAVDQELVRVNALVKKARAQGVPILCLHVGREARRGPLSDPFISPVVSLSQQVLVLAGGNKDGLFTRLAAPAKVPVREAADYRELVTRIGEYFGKQPVK